MAKAKPPKPKVVKQQPAEEKPKTTSDETAEDGKEAGPAKSAPKDFESFYMQQITAEFADDLDRIRNANDFNERSLPILVEALKQTASMYTEEEKLKVMGR